MVKKDNKHNFDLATPADAVDYDPLGNSKDNQSIKSVEQNQSSIIQSKSDKQFFFKKSTFFEYIVIIIFSVTVGLVRWSFLDREFPLIGLSDLQIKSMKIKELSKRSVNSTIDFLSMQEIVANKLFSIIDARDIESYSEGYIETAINIDSYLLIEDGDEIEADKIYSFLDTLNSEKIVIYCWNPDCDRAEFLKAFLIDSGFMLESNILIYEGGWDEWQLINNN